MLKSVCVDFKKSAYVLDKEALKKSKYNADKKFQVKKQMSIIKHQLLVS